MDNTKFWSEIETLNYDVFNKITGESEQSAFVDDFTVMNKVNHKSGVELLNRTIEKYYKFKKYFLINMLEFGIYISFIIRVCLNRINKNSCLDTATLLSVLSYETVEFCKVNFNANDITLFVQLAKTAVHSTFELIQELALYI